MEDLKKIAEFRRLLRTRLPALLGQFGYVLSFDNEQADQKESRNWVFRLRFSGKNQIEIHNDDWRDYTEYFRVKLNDTELRMLNLHESESIEMAFEELQTMLMNNV